ncbi:HK97 gp10 family phage protein [Bradyrhizobium elkanii]|jgi:hypothetical protein|uniref:HK97 gp10 family phage protein n=1 Tax=Bradyrhizobium elkanii TaxID=29448 RepID=UPI0022270817|nr:HK97 gp10 family phage protein [Bradyrhizobium elkanii]MCW2228094.1 hypothetical protein [Bradyrhizobium elkanii]
MAVSGVDFAAQVDAWCKESEARLTAVFRQSAQDVSSIAQGYLSGDLVKVQTGFLRASVRASKDEMPPINRGAAPKEGQSYSDNFGQIVAVIATAQLGETIYVGWTANYAVFVHYGTTKMPPRPWVSLSAEQWPTVVARNVERAKSLASSQP